MVGIYLITNLINGKQYVGQTNDLKRRIAEYKTPKYANRGYAITNAIKEFGIDNFRFETLEECQLSELDEKEVFWIAKLKPSYNKNVGGKGNKGYIVSDSTKSILSEYGEKQWNEKSDEEKEYIINNNLTSPIKGHDVSKKTREKIRRKLLGKTLSKVHCEKISNALKNKPRENKHFWKKVYAFNSSSVYIFDSIKNASEYFSVKSARIVAVLSGRRLKFRDLYWNYWSVETNGDECNHVGAILSRIEVQGSLKLNRLKVEEIVHASKMANSVVNDKGMIQLAMRSGQYKTINVTEVYEGEIKNENRFTGEYTFGEKTSDKVVGYMAYFSLTNGFEKYMYMSREDCEKHGKKFSQTYKRGGGLWSTDFDSMSKKTVLKMLISKFGILSIDMQRAQAFDQAVVKSDLTETDIDDAEVSYDDNPTNEDVKRNAMKEALQDAEVVDETTGEIFNQQEQ